MTHVAMAAGWMLAGVLMVAVAGNTGRRIAEIETDYPAMIVEAAK